ncbi:MAG: EAL domain-containing protein [Propionivibrio sp.]
MMAMLSPTEASPDTPATPGVRSLAGNGARRFGADSANRLRVVNLHRGDGRAAAVNAVDAMPADPQARASALQVRRIIDAQGAAFGRELIFRASREQGTLVSMQLREQLHALAAAAAYPAQKIFVRASAELINHPAIDWLPASAQIFALDFAGAPDDALLARCRMLRERGFSFALADYTGIDERSRPLLSMLDIVEIRLDEGADRDERRCHDLAGSLARLPVKLLASGVANAEQLAWCRRAGFHLFSGEHIAPLEPLAAHGLPVSRAGLMRLLALVIERSDWARIEDACKREPALVYNLLHLARQASRQSAPKTLTLRQALTLLDEHALRCWLELQLSALESGNRAAADSAVAPTHVERGLQLAALGGRLLELFVRQLEPGDPELAAAAYLAGSLSLLPTALNLPLGELVQDFPVRPEVSHALRHEGVLGQCLVVLEQFGKRDALACDRQIRNISRGKLGYPDLQACFAEALAWLTASEE